MSNSRQQPSAVTVGTFDGYHRGHQAVVRALRSEAAARCLEPIAVGFDRHPLATVCPQRAPRLLSAPALRRRLIGSEGVKTLEMEFTPKAAAMTARDFIRLLRDSLNARLLIIGYDNTFGSDGVAMSVADYIQLGREEGVEVLEAPLVDGISSSAIRKKVAAGDINNANEMLGRMFQIKGTVVHGHSIGHTLGYPTANLRPTYPALYPKNGVYAAVAELVGGRKVPAIVNVGLRPTLGNAPEPQIEAHLLDFNEDLYGQELTLHFAGRVRDERKFANLQELQEAIASDLTYVRLNYL
ncbi:MAG: riboflavin biosynthesis protein RibF [Clostridium sp.]|nr:riboflavin biosynthesis protein RibF [Prevotella sp.]MCM1428454.1 riboflavin biosynthesis protein RibF [Clostridium sp.]MCM1474919.1 riboflavin biosynthesis protein RibF [Muribaculaceae bacterium]